MGVPIFTIQKPECKLDPKDVALIKSLVGRTIVKAEWKDDCKGEIYTEHEYALLTLDDGRVIRFGSDGYDACAVTVDVINSKESRPVQ